MRPTSAFTVTEQLTLKVPMIPVDVLKNYTKLKIKIVVCNDVNIGTKEVSDISHMA